MSDTVENVAFLSEAAERMHAKANRFYELTTRYVAVTRDHDEAAEYLLGQVVSASLQIKGQKRGREKFPSTQLTIPVTQWNEELLRVHIENKRKEALNIMEQIEELVKSI